ncbi:MAG: DASH family cryptochrome [Bacteroidota bacterium]
MSKIVNLLYLRNDLRLHDNETLVSAIENADQLIIVYCYDPRQYRMLPLGFRKTGYLRFRFLQACLEELSQAIQQLGSRLIIRVGHAEDIIPELATRYGVNKVYAQKEVADEEVKVEQALAAHLSERNIELELVWGKTLYHIDDMPFAPEKTPITFKSFRNKITKKIRPRELSPRPTTLPDSPVGRTGSHPSASELGFAEEQANQDISLYIPPGEKAALKRLEYYSFESDLITRYKYTRNKSLGLDYSSKFSAYLSLGCLSPRQIYYTVKRYEREVKRNISTWWLIFEVTWRDFFKFQCMRFGNLMFSTGGIRNRETAWIKDKGLFNRWKKGDTGIPFLDAHMRELSATGFMSNRGRVNAASFLSKDYQIDWRWGAAWFEHHLLDYDVCSNWINWNTQALEMYYTNPVHQALKYDKKGEYTLTRLPELTSLPKPLYHAPWLLSEETREGHGVLAYNPPVEVYKKWGRAIAQIKKAAS